MCLEAASCSAIGSIRFHRGFKGSDMYSREFRTEIAFVFATYAYYYAALALT